MHLEIDACTRHLSVIDDDHAHFRLVIGCVPRADARDLQVPEYRRARTHSTGGLLGHSFQRKSTVTVEQTRSREEERRHDRRDQHDQDQGKVLRLNSVR